MTAEQALQVIKSKKYHKFYDKSVEYALDLAIHADEAPPGDMVTKRRPKESEEIKKYRESIRIAKTEAPVSKVFTSLEKIRRSYDWMIKYPKEVPATIAENETLEYYMEYDFPRYTSFTNWFFSVGFKQYLIDANCISVVFPEGIFSEVEMDENEYLEPYPVIFNSHQILDYSRHHYLLHSEEKNVYRKNNMTIEGNIYYLVDEEFITEIKETDPKPLYEIKQYAHGMDELPIVQFHGVIKKEMRDITLCKSRISPMIPELKEAYREYSDLQAEIVQHVHSTLWAFAGQACSKCNGTGRVIGGKDKAPIECKACKGKGTYPFNPFENFEVQKPKAGETALPTPPAGYINKQIDIAQLQDKRVQDHIYNALSSIGFEFLASSPLNQSGTAKEIDRSEIDSFIYSVAEDIVRIFDDHYYIINNYRYAVIIQNEEDREKLLPYIPVPQKYTILSEDFIVDEITKAKATSLNKSIITAAEIEYAHKKYANDTDAQSFVINCIELDPFPSEAEDVLIMKLQNGGITKRNYVVHCNIKDFVRKAVEEDKGFYEKTIGERRLIIEGYADAMIADNSPSGKVLKMINQRSGNPEGNMPMNEAAM